MNEIRHAMTKVTAPLGDKTIALFRDDAQSDDGAIYFTAKEGAEALELSSYRKFLKLVREHRDELVVGEEIVPPQGTIAGNRPGTKLFRISVLDLLGPLTKSEAGKKIRRWTADIRHRFRTGASAEITREQFDALKATLAQYVSEAAALKADLANARADLRLSLASNRETAKLASGILRERKAEKRREADAELFEARGRLVFDASTTPEQERVLLVLATKGAFATVADLAKSARLRIALTEEALLALHSRGLVRRADGKIALAPQGGSGSGDGNVIPMKAGGAS